MVTQTEIARLPVIVRAWGDEPVALRAFGIKGDRVLVGSDNCKRPIGLPMDQVFAFDDEAFAEISAAYTRGERDKVAALFQALAPFNFEMFRK